MAKKRGIFLCLIVFVFVCRSIYAEPTQDGSEKGSFSIYFRNEKVGYEEYIWKSEEKGYILTVRGRLTKPVPLEIDHLSIRLDKSFIPVHYEFNGSVSGLSQKISSRIIEGDVENTIHVAGQEQKSTEKIRRDAYLLPNPIYSCFMILTKKFRCSLQEKVELSAYIIPQIEVPFSLGPNEENLCFLNMMLNETQIELETDDKGTLLTLQIPARNLRVVRDKR